MYRLLFITPIFFLLACSDTPSTAQTTKQEPAVKKVAPASAPQQSVEKAAVQPAQKVAQSNESGHSVYAHKCASCHGQSGEKVALNTSKIIAGWQSKKTVEALNGYKDGSYGGKLKGIMKGQVSTLNDDQLKSVADFIETL